MGNVTLKTGLNQAETVVTGINAAVCKVSLSATTSVGDVLRVGRLPHNAIVVDAVWYAGAAYVDNAIFKAGLSGTEAAILASDSYSVAGFGAANGNGCHINVNPVNLNTSVSDTHPVRYKHITVTPTAEWSVGHYMTLMVFYKMPGQEL